MASFGSKVRGRIATRTECGKVHHCIGPPSLPEEGAAGPAFAQLHIVDPADAANNGCLDILSTSVCQVCD